MGVEVVILGCGPSGLMAAKAVEDSGHEPVIISRKVKSRLGGAMYVHAPIPGLTSLSPHACVTYVKMGTREGYAAKVYGDPKAPCSWDIFPEGEHAAWDMARVYDRLWDEYQGRIINETMTPEKVEKMTLRQPVVSTIPLHLLCHGDHIFEHATIWIRRGPMMTMPQGHIDPFIVYNGDPYCGWYRASRLFGMQTAEFGHRVMGAEEGIKPTTTTCDCHPDIIKAGRFGEWKKGILITDAYHRVMEALS